MRNIWRYLIYTGILLLLAACTRQPRNYVIGVSQCSEDIWREKLNNEMRIGQFAYDDVTLKFASAQDDDMKQISQIEEFIREGVDLLIVSPNQVHTISQVLDRAYDQGIPVILFDRKTDSKKYTAFIGANNYHIGQTMAQLVANSLQGHGTVMEIEGLKGSSAAQLRHDGFADVMRDYPGITVVSYDENHDWTERSGEEAFDNLYNKVKAQGRNVDAVFGHNDRLAAGARKAALRSGVTGAKYFGIDALPSPSGGIEMVKRGELTASYVYPTRGNEVMDLAMSILKKKPYKKENPMDAAVITKDNADIMLMQDAELKRQGENINRMHSLTDRYFNRINAQRTVIATGLALSAVIVFLLIYVYRMYISKSRLNDKLRTSNDELTRVSSELKEMTNARLAFFTNVSHELRTPLTLIADPTERLIDSEKAAGRQENVRSLELIERNVKVLRMLVNEILDFRKIQSGKMQLHLSRFSLKEKMTEWHESFESAAHAKGITSVLNLPENNSSMIEADRERVAHIYYNLMNNAMKYTPEGGVITTTLTHADGEYAIIVEDSGKDIDPSEFEKIFEDFHQAPGSVSGTGLGLPLVKAIAEQHHGHVKAENRTEGGARFVVTLPERQKPDVPQKTTETAENVNSRRRIEDVVAYDDNETPEVLVIDDNKDMRDYLRTILSGSYKVSEADDGETGLRLAQRIVPDIVISDVMMPVMDGLEFCNHLKQEKATSHIPVILLTARDLDEQRAEGYAHGADAYISKPFSSKTLLTRVDNLLKSRAMLRNLYSANTTSFNTTATPEIEQDFISRLRTIIQDNLADSDLSVEKIGDEIGLSRVQLYRKVKAVTGLSPVELLRKARLERARHLLQTTDRTISEVAYAVGFSTPSYFTKCYKEEYGTLPRKKHQ